MIKRGQINLSFGMIFSIVLIIVFIAFAIYAIVHFLALQDSIKLTTFDNTIQNDVSTVWNSAYSTKTLSYNLPTSIQEVCFTNIGNDNLILYAGDNKPETSYNIDHINITATTAQGDLCFNVVNGQFSLNLQKKFSDTLVTITK
jgi:uncharacterized protein (UPF0333 family)